MQEKLEKYFSSGACKVGQIFFCFLLHSLGSAKAVPLPLEITNLSYLFTQSVTSEKPIKDYYTLVGQAGLLLVSKITVAFYEKIVNIFFLFAG